jgi:hypothetical protein
VPISTTLLPGARLRLSVSLLQAAVYRVSAEQA